MYHFVRAIYRSYRGREAAMQSLTKELSQELNLLDQEEILIKMLHRLDISDEFGLNDNLKNIDEKIKEIVNELIHEEKIHKKIHLVDKLADLEDEIEVDKTNASMVRFSSNLKKISAQLSQNYDSQKIIIKQSDGEFKSLHLRSKKPLLSLFKKTSIGEEKKSLLDERFTLQEEEVLAKKEITLFNHLAQLIEASSQLKNYPPVVQEDYVALTKHLGKYSVDIKIHLRQRIIEQITSILNRVKFDLIRVGEKGIRKKENYYITEAQKTLSELHENLQRQGELIERLQKDKSLAPAA